MKHLFMRMNKLGILVLGAVSVAVTCLTEAQDVFPILRTEEPPREFSLSYTEIELPDGLIQRTYALPGIYLGPPPKDDDSTGEPPRRKTVQQILESAGIIFSEEGSSASLDYNFPSLVVTLPETELKKVSAYVDTLLPGVERYIVTRVEIYEVPSSMALEIFESASPHSNHRPERDALIRLVDSGAAKLIAFQSVPTRSGQRAKFTNEHESKFEAVSLKEASPTSTGMSPNHGLAFAVDPVLGADGRTIDLNLSLSFDTAPPEGDVFHRKEITTQVTTAAGDFVILGSWTPTGARYTGDTSLTQLVFLTTNIQEPGR